VFFNVFSEAEPFAAILIARGTHAFLGRLLRPEGSEPPPHQLEDVGEHCKLPHRDSGGANTFWTY